MSVLRPYVRERHAYYADGRMMSVWIAIVLMMVATTAVHLGLPQAISKVLVKVFGCHKCLSFWTTLVVLQIAGVGLPVALPLSFVSAYLSNWFALVLIVINKWYEKVWERLNR